MTRTALVLSALSALLTVACGQSATSAARADLENRPAALWTDADRYQTAMDQAVEAYATEVDHAELAYPGMEPLGADRFDALLAHSLARFGLTIRGLGVHADRHPEFRRELTVRHADRVAELQARATGSDAAPVASVARSLFDDALASR
jgi:hypothetical protein